MSDPLASIRQWKVSVQVGEFAAIIPEHPASVWLEVILAGDFSDLFHTKDYDCLIDMLSDGSVAEEQFQQAMYDAVAVAAGRDWPMALRLCSELYDTQLRGEVLMRLDLERVPLGAVLDAVYAMHVRWMKKEDREAYDAELNSPAPLQALPGDPRERLRRQRELSRERAGAIGGPSARSRPTDRQSPEPDPQGA